MGGSLPGADSELARRAGRALQLGRLAEARSLLEEWLRREPEGARPRLLLGLALEREGDLEAAATAVREATESAPHDPEAWFHRGRILSRLERWTDAEAALRQSLRLRDDVPEAHNNLGVLLMRLGRPDDAVEPLRRALALRPGYADAHCNLGDALERQGRPAEAEACYRRALEAQPDNARAGVNLAAVLAALGREPEAAGLLEDLCRRLPAEASAWSNLAELRLRQGQMRAAQAALDSGLAARPDSPELLAQHVRLLSIRERFAEADAVLQRGLDLAPEALRREFLRMSGARHADSVEPPLDPRAFFVQYWFEHLADDWEAYGSLRETLIGSIREALAEGAAIALPNTPAHLGIDDPALEHDLARRFAQRIELKVAHPFPPVPSQRRHGRITVGFASPVFGRHAIDHVSQDLYRLLDRRRFRVVGYALGRRADGGLRETGALFDEFVDVSGMDNRQAAERIRSDRPDLLLDLYGYGPEQRPEIFARRPAPIQLSQVGLPGTSGARWIDYRIATRAAIPPELARHFSEHIAYVPVTHHVLAGFPERQARPERRDVGLPENAFVYSCFHRISKLTPELLDAWGDILGAVDEAVLWLRGSRAHAEAGIREALRRRGVAPARIVFAPPVSLGEHVARQYLADAFLNTFAYSGFNTVAVALWCGVPVVAQTGRTFAARTALSALEAVGLEQLVCGSAADYREAAIGLARDETLRRHALQQLHRDNTGRTLFAAERIARYFERAFETMVERHRAGLPPESFTVPDD